MHIFSIRIILPVLVLAASAPTHAADLLPALAPQPQAAEKEPGWEFNFAPYFWMAGLNGDVGAFGLPTVHVDEKFKDILSDLDFGFMAAGEARYDRFSLLADVIYVKVSTSDATPRGIIASEVDVESKTFTAFLGAGYSVLEDAKGHLDVVGGARIWSGETKISLTGGILDGASRSDSATWVDGVGGLRGSYSITPEVFVTGWGLVGAGGADIDWDVAGAIGYNFNDRISAVAGYRALGVNYSSDGFVNDTVMSGPILGVNFRF